MIESHDTISILSKVGFTDALAVKPLKRRGMRGWDPNDGFTALILAPELGPIIFYFTAAAMEMK
jgi:hypothetical protein